MMQSGSSPRVRGTHQTSAAYRYPFRFIPACAGNALRRAPGGWSTAVHPRVCGERGHARPFKSMKSGSSPRVRGTPSINPPSPDPMRFIPACAGNAWQALRGLARVPVHPRVCGERTQLLSSVDSEFGSSPRVRGTPIDRSDILAHHRFIPACAGNAWFARGGRQATAVHPRVCGERPTTTCARLTAIGSSPRVRGTLDVGPAGPLRVRFIPACAGNARCWSMLIAPPTVHPRVCGERFMASVPPTPDDGSSPRVRGTRVLAREAERQARFIPACAGNAVVTAAALYSATVHPRVCGERTLMSRRRSSRRGSSPRVRGTRCRWQHEPTPPPVHPRVCGER